MLRFSKITVLLILLSYLSSSCSKGEIIAPTNDNDIKGFSLLTELTGHWVGTNQTAYGFFNWFSFDFRPISPSHLHTIYEGGTNQNIITSIFIADYDNKQQLMIRNGGWLGDQYRATYFILDKAENNGTSKYYRLVDAVGGEKRAYIEFRFERDTLYFDAYKDNSGSLDEPVKHMEFIGTNYNPSFAQAAMDLFEYPQKVSEINLENKFVHLIDPDSALFLDEADDPFPKSDHGHLSDLKINITRDTSILNENLLLYISKAPLVSNDGQVDFDNLNTKVVRTVEVHALEDFYETTYLHPDKYFITAFSDRDNNYYPSEGDISNGSKEIEVTPEGYFTTEIVLDKLIHE